MDEKLSGTDEELYSVLQGTLPLIRNVLVSQYKFVDEEAEAFEETLAVWFRRVARRIGTCRMERWRMREQLLFVTCKYARAFQIARFKGIEPANEGFTLTLARPPEEVALEMLHRFPARPSL